MQYAVDLSRATRPQDELADEQVRRHVEWGAGTRAGQYMVLIGKALAVIQGQPVVSVSHIRQAAGPVMRHRVLLNYRGIAEGVTPQQIIRSVVERVKA